MFEGLDREGPVSSRFPPLVLFPELVVPIAPVYKPTADFDNLGVPQPSSPREVEKIPRPRGRLKQVGENRSLKKGHYVSCTGVTTTDDGNATTTGKKLMVLPEEFQSLWHHDSTRGVLFWWEKDLIWSTIGQMTPRFLRLQLRFRREGFLSLCRGRFGLYWLWVLWAFLAGFFVSVWQSIGLLDSYRRLVFSGIGPFLKFLQVGSDFDPI